MKLVVAEKPSVAQSLAAVLGAKEKKDGYLEGGGWLVSWCVGHLVELAQPDSGLGPEDGAQILPAEQLELSREGSLLRAALCYDGGERADLALYLPLSGEGRP